MLILGGTTDFSVIEYRSDFSKNEINETVKTNDPTARLKAKLLYKDGKTIAGDALVKKIIEDVLIPCWIKSSIGEIESLTNLEKEWLGKCFLSLKVFYFPMLILDYPINYLESPDSFLFRSSIKSSHPWGEKMNKKKTHSSSKLTH